MINIAKPAIGQEEKQAVLEVLDSGMIACGSVVSEFEKEFATYLKTPQCIATTSGTVALEVALRAAGIGEGDVVLTTPFSFIASTNAILYTGARPVFTDIDPRTFNIKAENIERSLAKHPEVKALLIVHLFGLSCNMDEIMPIVKKHGLILIEDCAQSHGALWNGKNVGTFGTAGCYSFYPTKNMTTSEGGAVVSADTQLVQNCRMLINHGMQTRYYHDMIGYNYRMTNICGAIGRCQLQKLDDFNDRRIAHAAFYNENIDNRFVTTPYCPPEAKHVYHQYTLRISDGRRDDFVKHLQNNGVGFGVFYPLSIPEQKCYEEFGFKKDWQITDQIKNEVVSIPVHPLLMQTELDEVVRVINAFG